MAAKRRASPKPGPELVTNANTAVKSRSLFLAEMLGHQSPKHDHYSDFGWPKPGNLTFASFYAMYSRNGLAHGAVNMTVEKTWETLPEILETAADKDQTKLELALSKRLRKIRFWQNAIEADKRGMVGCYAGLILRIGDGKRFDQPVDGVRGGLEALIEVIPAWEGQLTVGEFDTDEASETYGQPKMFQFNEAQVGDSVNKTRSFQVHPDRVLILSDSGTVHDRSALEPGYNALLDCEKISGAGGEGFWKNAKAAPILEVDKEARLADMAKAMNVDPSELYDKISDQVDDYNTGLDKALMLQGIKVGSHNVSLPSPEYFFNVSLQVFCSSMSIPQKILIGMQTGERASQEDQSQWAKTNMSRREMRIVPFLEGFIDRLVKFGMLKESEWVVEWRSLMEDSPSEMIELAKAMADINQTQSGLQPPFTHDEIRQVAGYDPLSPADMVTEEDDWENQGKTDDQARKG